MKRIIFTLILLMCSGLLLASSEPIPGEVVGEETYFTFQITSRDQLEELTRIISIDNVDGYTVYAYANQRELEAFKRLGISYSKLPHPGTLIIPEMAPSLERLRDWDYYPTYDQYVTMMYQFEADYPALCEIVDIGSTVEGRQLLFAKISDNIGLEEDEPEFMYTSTMHGDETTGYVLMLRLIDYLLSNYGTDAEVTEMVNRIEIWINPNANPDGTYHDGNHTVYGAIRNNANGYDLNRNFPDPEDGMNPNGPWQPETIAMMDIAEANSFIHSANFHGGVEVVNYPWDTWAILHADNDWYYDISRAFADTAHIYAPAGYMTFKDNGVTNGFQWYTIEGGRQDYMNWFQACREVCIEISDTKLLPATQLDAHWGYLKRSLIKYIQNVYYGIRGIVTDDSDGPVDAMITVVDHDFDNSEVFTDPDVGDYHRMLSPGIYDITVSAYGYIPQTITDITVVDTGATRVDVQLIAAQTIDVSGTVKDGDTNQPIGGATVEILDSPHDPVQTDFSGNYLITGVMEGTYTFQVTADGYVPMTQEITVTQDNHVINFNLYQPYLFWDFENDNGGFSSNNPSGWQWGEPTAGGITAYSGSKLWGTNLGGFYQNNVDWMLESPEITLSSNPMLAFYHMHYFEGGSNLWDGGNVSISTNGGASFTVIDPLTLYDGTISALDEVGFGGTLEEWTLVQFDLHDYGNEDVIIRWHFASDYSVSDYYGWYIDDVAIIEQLGSDVPHAEQELLVQQNFPNPFSTSTTISFSAPTSMNDATLTIYNLKGQLVKEMSLQPFQSTFIWDGKDINEKQVSSGVYFYKIASDNYTSEIKKMVFF